MKLQKILVIIGLLLSFSSALAQDTDSERVGFLNKNDFMDSVALLPEPPAIGSVAFLNDEAMYYHGLDLRRSERGQIAKNDADLSLPVVLKGFSDSFGLLLSQENTPKIYELLKKAVKDAKYAAYKPKQHYNRIRPFVLYQTTSCAPEDETYLSTNGSYPSGHTMVGTTVALILTEINPEKQNEILKHGYEYGQSRVICGCHFQSDVDAARLLSALVVNRLHANAEFAENMKKAKEEFQSKK